jgi:hypothetical protein
VKEYDLFVPLFYNDGAPIEQAKIEAIGEQLLAHFTGLTFFPQPNQGFWKLGNVTFRDQIVIFRVLADNTRAARRFFAKFKEQLKKDLGQEEILIVERSVEAL